MARSEYEHVLMRRRWFAERVDLGAGVGLEIGPLDSAIASREIADVRYLDVFSRDKIVSYYEQDGHGVDAEAIPEIDFALERPDGSFQGLSEAVAGAAPYSWVVASHVIEHVPDVVSWLQQVAEILLDDGTLLLVVPDRRFCFDAHRSPASVGGALLAYDHRDLVPSVAAVFDHFRYAVSVDVTEAWAGAEPSVGDRVFGFEMPEQQVEKARAGEYVDAHVWPMTPRELVSLIDDLGRLGLHDFVLREVSATAPYQLEFYVILERLPRSIDTAGAAEARAAGVEKVLDGLPAEDLSVGHRLLAERAEKMTTKIEKLEDRVTNARAARDRARATNRRLRNRIARLERAAAAPPPGLRSRIRSLLRVR